MRDVRVQGRKPSPIWASAAPVRYLMIDVLPLCVLPNSQSTGTGACWRRWSRLRARAGSSRRNVHSRFTVSSMVRPPDLPSVYGTASEGNLVPNGTSSREGDGRGQRRRQRLERLEDEQLP